MGTAIKHPVPDGVKTSLVIFDIQALWCSALNVRAPRLQIDYWPGVIDSSSQLLQFKEDSGQLSLLSVREKLIF